MDGNATWRAWMPALLLAVSGAAATGLAHAWPHPASAANQPLAIYAWNRDAVGVAIEAGARILSPGALSGSIVAIADDPEILVKLYESGAALVLRADIVPGCATPENTPTVPQNRSGIL